MAGIVLSYTRHLHGPNCTHGAAVVSLDGEQFTFQDDERDLAAMEFDKRRFLRDTLYYWHVIKGVPLNAIAGRVCFGEEATNVKVYQFFGPGAAITKTNIGTAYVNICAGSGGEPIVADFTGCTQYRIRLYANLIGTGQWGAQVKMFNGAGDVLHAAPNLGAAGERTVDSGWQNLPAAFLGQGLVELVAQAKSTTAADDPVFRSLSLGLK